MQLENVHTAARHFHLDVGHWPRDLSQLADEPGTGAAGRADVFGDSISQGAARGWKGPYLNVPTLRDESVDLGGHGEIASPFAADGDPVLDPDAADAGRVRWLDGALFFLAEPVRRQPPPAPKRREPAASGSCSGATGSPARSTPRPNPGAALP